MSLVIWDGSKKEMWADSRMSTPTGFIKTENAHKIVWKGGFLIGITGDSSLYYHASKINHSTFDFLIEDLSKLIDRYEGRFIIIDCLLEKCAVLSIHDEKIPYVELFPIDEFVAIGSGAMEAKALFNAGIKSCASIIQVVSMSDTGVNDNVIGYNSSGRI